MAYTWLAFLACERNTTEISTTQTAATAPGSGWHPCPARQCLLGWETAQAWPAHRPGCATAAAAAAAAPHCFCSCSSSCGGCCPCHAPVCPDRSCCCSCRGWHPLAALRCSSFVCHSCHSLGGPCCCRSCRAWHPYPGPCCCSCCRSCACHGCCSSHRHLAAAAAAPPPHRPRARGLLPPAQQKGRSS